MDGVFHPLAESDVEAHGRRKPSPAVFNFYWLQDRLTGYLRSKVRAGDWSERGLAKHCGVSQPHLHNVLKGVRVMTPALGDAILFRLGLSVFDLVSGPEMEAARDRRAWLDDSV